MQLVTQFYTEEMLIREDCLICENTLAKCNKDAYSLSLHLSTVDLRCKLQEKLHRVTWSLLYLGV